MVLRSSLAQATPFLSDAETSISLELWPPQRLAEEVLAARPRLYERKNCTAQRRSDALYFNLPRVHDLEGGNISVLRIKALKGDPGNLGFRKDSFEREWDAFLTKTVVLTHLWTRPASMAPTPGRPKTRSKHLL